jgi:hypothetical protein
MVITTHEVGRAPIEPTWSGNSPLKVKKQLFLLDNKERQHGRKEATREMQN